MCVKAECFVNESRGGVRRGGGTKTFLFVYCRITKDQSRGERNVTRRQKDCLFFVNRKREEQSFLKNLIFCAGLNCRT